ncbi:MAG: cupin domain-containing protein [Gaiellaceae bacterium]
MPVKEASSEETPYGRYITSDGWFVLNLADALAVRNEEKGGASYPLEPRESPFGEFGAHVRVVWPGDPSALYHSENAQEGFLVLAGECTLIVEEQERTLRQWDYFHCPADTAHVIVGAGDGPCAILMIGARPEVEKLRYPVSDVAAKYGASAAKETDEPDEAYADWPGDYEPVRLPWPPESGAKP